MRKILLYLILVIILFSGYSQVRQIWQENEESLDGTYSDIKEGVLSWYQSATDKSIELKKELNEKINVATDKYEKLKSEVENTTDKINEKREQLDNTLKEIEEAKNALDELLEQNPDLAEEETSTGEGTSAEEASPDETIESSE